MKNISIIGSTGSIGVNTLRIVRKHTKKFRVVALAVKKNIEELAAQAREFNPQVVCVYEKSLAPELRQLWQQALRK